jgi:autotransporter-associated beta strand protein
MNLRRALLLGACLVSAAFSAAYLHGATRTWTGGGADNTWANAANWDTGAPANGDSVVFNGVTRLQPTNNISSLILNGLSFSSSSFNLVGLSLTNNGGMFDNAGNNTNNIPQIMPVSQGITNNASLTLVNAGTINITNTGVNVWLGGSGVTFLNGVISGLGMLTLGNDGGTVRLGAANTFRGGVNINNSFGTVLVGNAGAFPSGAGIGDVTNNSTINLNGTSITVNGLYGSGIIDNQTGTATYAVTVGNNSTNSAGTFSGGIQNSSGNVGLTKVNTNVFTFNGSGNYNGPTLISAGSFVLGASAGLFSTASITVSPGAVLDLSAQSGAFLLNSGQALNAGRATNGGPSDVVGSFSSSGIINPLRAAAPGTMNINGGLTLNGGTINFDLGNSLTLGSGVNDLIVLNGQLAINGATTVGLNPLAGTFASGTYTLISNATTSVSGSAGNLSADLPRGLSATFDITTQPGSLLLTMSGTASPASLVWSGANNCDWDVRVTQNWLNGASADYFFNLDSVIFNDTAACTTVALNNGVSPGSTIFANFSTNYTISGSGAISGNGTLTVNGGGTVTLNTPNNYGGDTFVNNGSTLIAGVLPAAPHIAFYNGLATLGNLQLGGGGVYFSDEQNDTYRNNFNNLIINPGAASLAERNRASSSSYIIQFNSVVRSGAGGTVDFNNVQSKSASPQVGLLITNTTTVNGILSGFATFNESDWVVPVATGGGSTAYAAYQTSTTPTAWGVASNVSLTANPSANLNNTVINSLKLANSTVTLNSGQSLTLTSGGLLVPNAGAAATITGGTLLGATNLDLIVHEHSAVGTLTIGSAIADNTTGSALTKSGQGTLILTGANTYTGPTYINGQTLQGPGNQNATTPGTPTKFAAGTLQIGNGGSSGSISSSSGVTNNANLAFNRSDPITFGLPISGNGALKVLAGNVTLTGNNSYKGATTISAGTLQVGNGGTSGSLGNTASITDNGSLIFNHSDSVSYAGVISGLGSLTQQGTGLLTLGGANTYAGNTVVTAGTLALGAGGSLSNSPVINVNSAAIFDASAPGGITLNGTVNQGLSGTGTVKGNITTTTGSSLNPAGTGTIGTLTLNNALGLNGGTYYFDISNGSRDQLVVGGNLALNGGLLQLNVVGSPLANGTYKLISYSGSLSGLVGNLSVAGFNQAGQVANLSSATAGEIDLVVSSYVALNLTWRGDGLNNKWDVNTTADWINGGGASVFHNFDNATFDDTGSNTPPINLVGTLAPAVVTVNAVQDYTFAGNGLIDGGSSLVKNNTGNLFLLTTNNYTGTTTINNGTVQVGNGVVSGDIGTGNITDNASLIFNQPDSRSAPANISGPGQLTQQGSGTLTLLGNNSYGATTVASGVLQVGEGLNAGTLGSGLVTNNSTLILNRNGSLVVNNAITGSGMLIVDGPGTVNLGGANSYQNNTYISNGIVRLTASEVIPDGGTTTGWLILDGSPTVAGTFDLNGFNESVNGLSGLTDAVLGRVINNGGGTSTLFVNSIADTTFTGTIQDGSGKVALVKNGANTLTLQPGGNGNTFSGGTIISNGVVSGGNSTTANATMLGGGTVTFYGGTLQLGGFTGSTSPDYGTFGNPIVVPANASGTVFNTCRGGGFAPSTATGPASSTLTFVTRYVRGNFGGNWTGFNGLLVVSNNTASANTDFRFNTATGLPNGRMYLAAGAIGGVFMYNLVTGTPTIPIGELTGDATASIVLNSGSASGQPALWSVGGLNTSAEYDGAITDTHGIIKVGIGSWLLTSGNLTFTGPTIVSNGVLAFGVSAAQPPSSTYTLASPGKLDISSQGTLTVANMIQGNGTLLGSLVGNGTVMPGFSNAPGVLTVTNAVSLNGTTQINLNRTNSPNCGRLVAPSIAYGGTLTLANIGNTLLGGESFQAFSGALSGTFAATNLAALPPGLNWNLNNLAVNGSLSVVGQITPPHMGPGQVIGTTNIVGGTGGMAGATFRLLTSTNVASPLASWTQLGTGTFAADGSWSYTNIFATNSMLFYKVVEILP